MLSSYKVLGNILFKTFVCVGCFELVAYTRGKLPSGAGPRGLHGWFMKLELLWTTSNINIDMHSTIQVS